MRNIFIVLSFLVLIQGAKANMASPIQWGTSSGPPFIHNHIDINSEELSFTIDSSFNSAEVEVIYNIYAHEDTVNIPLLFVALDYEEDFQVWIDGVEVKTKPFSGYGIDIQDYQLKADEDNYIKVQFEEDYHDLVKLSECIFFTTPITAGKHEIKVNYKSVAWQDKSDWVTTKSFRYSLSPAKAWKSFGKLTLNIDAQDFNDSFKVNLDNLKFKGKTTFKFENLPQELIIISHKPTIPPFARQLIQLSPYGLMWAVGILLAIIHLFVLFKFRKAKRSINTKGIVVIGALIMPVLAFLSYMFSFDLIDHFIGSEANRYHGYTFMIFVLFPVVFPVYAIIIGLIDRFIIKRLVHD